MYCNDASGDHDATWGRDPSEPSLLLGVRGHLFCSIAGEVLKLSTISINSHLILGETTELFSFAVNESPSNLMLASSLREISPGGYMANWKHSLIVLPPKTSRTFQTIFLFLMLKHNLVMNLKLVIMLMIMFMTMLNLVMIMI